MVKKVLIVGSGGREHALGWKLKQSPHVGQMYFAPGNGGTEALGKNIDIESEEIERLASWSADNAIDLTVVGPEVPLAEGIVNVFEKEHLPVFGPSKEAARLESDKAWAIRFMDRHGIPHPESLIFHDVPEALAFVESPRWANIVVKASGLAAGKGVIVPESHEEVISAVNRIMVHKEFGNAGNEIVFQERLYGREVSVLAFTDGKTVVPLISAQDHKRAFDGDQGPNTGGMGVYAPTPMITEELLDTIYKTILKPTVNGLREEGNQYKGVLYAGLMLTDEGPQVLEFNARFGDPETQPLMMLLSSDLATVLLSCTQGNLQRNQVSFRDGAAACIVLAEEGYPDSPKKGDVIEGLDRDYGSCIQMFHAGTVRRNGQLITNGGRVVGITAVQRDLSSALRMAYSVIGEQGVYFQGMHYRRDIGLSVLQVK